MTKEELQAKWDNDSLTHEELVEALITLFGYSREAAKEAVYASGHVEDGDNIGIP